MPIGDLARQDEYPVDPMTGLPIGAPVSADVPTINTPMGSLLALRLRDEKSPVRHRTASPLVNITERDIGDAMKIALAMRRNRLGALAAQDNYQQ